MINRYWTTFETLAETERDCKERQLCMEDWFLPSVLMNHVSKWLTRVPCVCGITPMCIYFRDSWHAFFNLQRRFLEDTVWSNSWRQRDARLDASHRGEWRW